MFLSYGGYLACSMIALSAALTVFNWRYIPLVMVCEFVLHLGINASRGQLINPLETPGGKTLSSIIHTSFYLMMCISPWVNIRNETNIGGLWYSAIIVYRLLSCAAIVMYATSQFASIDDAREVAMSAETLRKMFVIALGVTIGGATLFLTFITSSYRWTFYSSKWTGPEFAKWGFDASQLTYGADTKDQQRVLYILFNHPFYLDKNKVKEWLLGLKSDSDLLGGGDKKLPKGCGQFTGHSLDSFFTKSLQRYAYYKDTEGFAQVNAHLDKLKEEVASRPLVDAIKAAVSRSPSDSREDNENEANDAPEIFRLRSALDEKERELQIAREMLVAREETMAANEAVSLRAIEERDATIAGLRLQLAEA